MSIGTKDNIESFNILFDHIYKENKEAKEISFKLLDVAHTWDDLVDGDKSVTASVVNRAFMSCVFELQRYPLWFQAGLDHHVLNCYFRWRDASNLEADPNTSDDDLIKCYMLRAGLYDLFVIIAYHLYGDEWAEEIGPIVRKFYGESPQEYLSEIRACQTQP